MPRTFDVGGEPVVHYLCQLIVTGSPRPEGQEVSVFDDQGAPVQVRRPSGQVGAVFTPVTYSGELAGLSEPFYSPVFSGHASAGGSLTPFSSSETSGLIAHVAQAATEAAESRGHAEDAASQAGEIRQEFETYVSSIASLPQLSTRPVILDTDWHWDVDDAVAMRLLLHAERIGLVDVLGVVINTRRADLPGSVNGLMAWEGRPGVPVGIHPSFVPSGDVGTWQADLAGLPHNGVGRAAAAPSDVSVYRKLLADSDRSVDIISIGFLTSLRRLLESPPDEHSALTGAALVAAKVRHLWVMGGRWPAGGEYNFNKETTVQQASSYVVTNWPTAVPVTFLGWEVGSYVFTGGSLNGTRTTDPVAEALADFGFGVATAGRQSWDPLTVWLACLGNLERAGYTAVQGTASVASNGSNTFAESPTGPHRYVVPTKPATYYAAELEKRLRPGVDPAPGDASGQTGPQLRIGRDPQPPAAPPSRVDGHRTGIVHAFHVADLADLADAALVTRWDDRAQRAPSVAASGIAPAIATDGQRVARFASGRRIVTRPVDLGESFTWLARVRWPTSLPGSAQTVLGASSADALATRVAHLQVTSGAKVRAVAWHGVNSTYFADTAGSVTAGSFATIGLRVTGTTVAAYLNGTWSAPVSGTAHNRARRPVAIGSLNDDGSFEPFAGDVLGVRLYEGVLTDAEVAAAAATL